MLFKSTTLASPKLRQRKRRAFKIKVGVIVIGMITFFAGLSVLSRLDALTVQTIEARGNAIVTPDDINAIVNKNLEGNILFVFSKRNFLLYPQEKIRSEIEVNYPILNKIEVKLKGLTTLEVHVSERIPKALWCEYSESETNPFTDSCYLMDANGYVYLKAPEFKGNPYIKYYGKLGQDPIRRTFEFIQLPQLMKFIEGVRSLHLTPQFLYVQDSGDYELHVRSGGKILFNDENDLPITLINLSTILQDNVSVPGKRESSINYVDLRYGNRVFFKLNGGPGVQTSSSTLSH